MASGRTTTNESSADIGLVDADHHLVAGHPIAPFRKIGHILAQLGQDVKSVTPRGQEHWF
jgi:hypothetical protein